MIDGEGYGWSNKRNDIESMPNPEGGVFMAGNSGSGAARISLLFAEDEALAHSKWIKDDLVNPNTGASFMISIIIICIISLGSVIMLRRRMILNNAI